MIVVCEQLEHCPYMNMMFKMVIVSMKMFVMIMVLKIGIEHIEPCPYLIVMIVSIVRSIFIFRPKYCHCSCIFTLTGFIVTVNACTSCICGTDPV